MLHPGLVRWLPPPEPLQIPTAGLPLAMARSPALDPLIPLPVRLPTSLVERLRAQADAAGVTLSDVLRSHLTLAEAKPLAKPRPQFRPKKLGEVSGADPQLLRQIASIGNNVNQLARTVNAGLLGGSGIENAELLLHLASIERHLGTLTKSHAH